MPGGPAAARAVAEWSEMGVDTVRIFALWSRIAPARRPSGFRAEDPNDPNYQWFLLDLAIDRVRAAGMSVTLTVTGPGPAWTSAAPGRRQGQWKPKPSAFGDFAEAVARRYGSRVDRYILWNEPNISSGCRRRRAARRAAARRSRRTSTAGSSAPPTRRSPTTTPCPRS